MPPPPAPRPDEDEELFAGRYRIEEKVGSGGMGEVWAAHDEQADRRVALKIIPLEAEGGKMTLARFEREAELSKELRARSFVDVYQTGLVGDRAFLAMELLHGESLQARLRRVGKLTPNEVLVMLRGIAGGLSLAHALQIVHRDLKPGNVFFAHAAPKSSGINFSGERDEVVKLLDFGIAKDMWSHGRLTLPGMLLGSTFYMSPEQIRSGSDVDGRADLWSIAVMLYRSLTGHRPFSGSATEVIAKIVYDDPVPPSVLDHRLTADVDAFFVRALKKDPNGRYQNVDELVQAFTRVIEPLTTAAPPVDGDEAGPVEHRITLAPDELPDADVVDPTVIEQAPADPEPELERAPRSLPPFYRDEDEREPKQRSIAPPPARRGRLRFVLGLVVILAVTFTVLFFAR